MTGAIAFDTHAYVKKLKAVGVSEEQAEVQAETLAELIDDKLATKRDLMELEERMKHELHIRLGEMKHDLTLRLGGMLVVGITVVATLVKIL
ncbi:MAG: DUF1640 domain-containing protein [Magnetococcales bacterium]|nr:DUF1640 domain-containing protein [Magnetococcales bacterium]